MWERAKVKRCCGVARGPSEGSLAEASVLSAAREAARVPARAVTGRVRAVGAELVDLPCLDLSLQVELPKLLSPALGRLCEAIAEDDEMAGEAVIDQVFDEFDTPVARARLAGAVIAARDRGRCGGCWRRWR